MRRVAQRELPPQIGASSRLAPLGKTGDEPSILHLQRTIGNQAVLRQLRIHDSTPPAYSASSQGGIAGGFFPRQKIQGKVPLLPADPIHGPLLDEYSRESGLPREGVTQHDPGYETWLLGRAIKVNINMQAPSKDPAPDYSKDENQLGAWERANFLYSVHAFAVCDHVTGKGGESSFVTDVVFELSKPKFEYFIASHIQDNMNDPTKTAGERIVWRQINDRIKKHAAQHFVRYRQVVESMRQTIEARISALPSRHHPVSLAQPVLEAYVTDLLAYLEARLKYELWRTTCDWEHLDYPNLLKGIPAFGTFKPACDPPPSVPPQPIMPTIVKP